MLISAKAAEMLQAELSRRTDEVVKLMCEIDEIAAILSSAIRPMGE